MKRLKDAGRGFYGGDKKFDELKPLLVALSSSFGGAASDDVEKTEADDVEQPTLSKAVEEERAVFFRRLCDAAPEDTDLPQLIVEDNLVGRAQLRPFYSLLVARTEASGDYDYEYTGFAQNAFSVADAEEAFNHAQSFRAAEPDGERVKW